MSFTLPKLLLVIEPGATLQITPERYLGWRELADAQGALIWSRMGMTRRVNTDVLDNALAIYDSYRIACMAGRLVEMPPESMRIRWEQAEVLRDPSPPIQPAQ